VTEVRTAPRAGTPRTPEDGAALARFNQKMSVPIILAAVIPLFLVPDGAQPFVEAVVFVAAWAVFVVDLVVHERRLVHYLGTWLGRFDLAVVVLTAPWFLLVGPSESRFVMIIRLARLARVVMATRGAHQLLQRIGRVAIVAFSVVLVGAAVAYRAEHPTNPGFATFGDALWWAIVTLTTVGYGDIVPKTTAGRVDGVMIMITGIAVLGLLAGSMASFFRLDRTRRTTAATDGAPSDRAPGAPGADGADGADDDDLVVAERTTSNEIAALRVEVARLADEVARLAARGDGAR